MLFRSAFWMRKVVESCHFQKARCISWKTDSVHSRYVAGNDISLLKSCIDMAHQSLKILLPGFKNMLHACSIRRMNISLPSSFHWFSMSSISGACKTVLTSLKTKLPYGLRKHRVHFLQLFVESVSFWLQEYPLRQEIHISKSH